MSSSDLSSPERPRKRRCLSKVNEQLHDLSHHPATSEKEGDFEEMFLKTASESDSENQSGSESPDEKTNNTLSSSSDEVADTDEATRSVCESDGVEENKEDMFEADSESGIVTEQNEQVNLLLHSLQSQVSNVSDENEGSQHGNKSYEDEESSGERSQHDENDESYENEVAFGLDERVDSLLRSVLLNSAEKVSVTHELSSDSKSDDCHKSDAGDKTDSSGSGSMSGEVPRVDSPLKDAQQMILNSKASPNGMSDEKVVRIGEQCKTAKLTLKTMKDLQVDESLQHDVLDPVCASAEFSECDPVVDSNLICSNFLKEVFAAIRQEPNSSIDAVAECEGMNCNIDVVCKEDEKPDSAGLPHVSSTPFKEPSSSVSPHLHSLQALVFDIPPITFDSNLYTESDSDSLDQLSTEEECNSSVDSDHAEDNLMSVSFFDELLKVNQPDISLDQSAMNASLDIIDESQNALSKACLLNNVKLHSYNDLSVNEAILNLMNLYLKNKLSKASVSRTIDMICKLLPENHNFPASSHLIFQYIQSLAPPMSFTVHYYCEQCLFYHGLTYDGLCVICNVKTKFHHFYNFDMSTLIKYFFEKRNLANIMDLEAEKRRNIDHTVLRDLKDGSVYKSLNINRGKYDVNIILNTDGVRVRRGSKKELWPVMITLAEVPIHLQKSFLTIVGVWYETKKPNNMKTYLRPFVESMRDLDHIGVQWVHPNTNEIHTSRVFLPVTVLDAPARAIVQNVLAYNGRYGCNICEIKSQKSIPIPNVKTRRIYNYVPNPILRTKERMLRQAQLVVETGQDHVRGVKGPSVLSAIPSADVAKCIVPEYLHSVLIGVVKTVLSIWSEKPGSWSIKDKIFVIDDFMSNFKHPDFVHRASRQFKSLSLWKASDYYYFLLFEALPTLQGRLADKYYQHFMLLVKAIFNLLKTEITESVVTEAELLLKLFVLDFGRLYGDRTLSHNVHQLLHLGLCVRRYGPLFCFSAFPFEDLNGMIAKATHGTNNIDMEIVNNIRICQGIQILKNIVMGQHGLIETSIACSSGEVLGKEVKPDLLSFLSVELNVLNDSNPKIYSRAKIGYDVFSSEIHKSLNSQDFYVMWKDDTGTTQYGSIKYFAQSGGVNFVVVSLFTVDHTQVFYHKKSRKCIEHFVPVSLSNKFIAVKMCDIVSTIVKVGKINSYIYLRPNLYRFVM